MLKRTLLPLAGLCLMLAVSCGPSFKHIQERSVAEAEYLRAEVAAKNIQGDDVAVAEGFFSRANATSGKESADFADLASAYYRIALARQSLEVSAAAVDQAEAALEESIGQVDKYQQLLSGMGSRGRRGEE